jgi:hypothetical protein
VSEQQRPEQGVEYAAYPNELYRVHRVTEAVRSLAKAWGVTETRAAGLLADPDEYRAELRSREDFYAEHEAELIALARENMTPQEKMRSLERRYAPGVQW